MVKHTPRKRKKTKSEVIASERKKRKTSKQKSLKKDNTDENQEEQTESLVVAEKEEINGANMDVSVESETPDPTKKINRKKKKRLENFLARKEKEEKRGGIFQTLSENAMKENELKLFYSSKTLGKKETTKEKLRRQLQEQRVGIVVHKEEEEEEEEDSHPLMVKVQMKTGDESEDQDVQESVEYSSDEDEVENDNNEDLNQDNNEDLDQDNNGDLNEENIEREEDEQKEEEKQREEDSEDSLENSTENKETNPNEQQKETKSNINSDINSDNHSDNNNIHNIREKKPTYWVSVNRIPEIEEQRKQLPVYMEEQKIMETIKDKDTVIICGETGSGKTTQVPQFLYEAGFGSPQSDHPGMIGITEPRRVAAISMAKRVAFELNLDFGRKVGYQIRYDSSSVTSDTVMKFMTDGILLKEIQSDFTLSKYSAIIIDEAHERSLNTDILIGLLSRIVPLRSQLTKERKKDNYSKYYYPLKLIIMSATLRVEDFSKNNLLFPIPPPVINVDSRQFPVTIHFNKQTPDDYVNEAYKKVCKIHKKLPSGGILVFVTGQLEIEFLCRKLRRKFPQKNSNVEQENETENEKKKKKKKEKVDFNEKELLAEQGDMGDIDISSMDSNMADVDTLSDQEDSEPEEPLYVLPLYSLLPTSQQLKVFDSPPDGCRVVVVATNVAETSLTIPGIKYVVDTGKVKELFFDPISGISQFKVTWTSQASANQRAGRAGRTGPGHCYRLYSSAMFNNHFDKFSKPEILMMPIEGIVLQMKSMSIENITHFPFPTPPDNLSMKTALKTLRNLGALDSEKETITDLGKTLAAFPVAPRFAKMLVLGKQGGCLPYVICIVAALSVKDPMLRVSNDENERNTNTDMDDIQEVITSEKEKQKIDRKKKKERIDKSKAFWFHPKSDLLALLKAIGAFEHAGATEQFCKEKYLYYKSMKEIQSLRQQITSIVNSLEPNTIVYSAKLYPPSDTQETLLRQIITSGLIDQVAVMQKDGPRAFYSICNGDEQCAIHPSSFLFSEMPEYCVYREIIHSSKPFMKGVTAIHPSWLANLGTPLCHFSKPLETPPPRYDSKSDKLKCFVNANYGPHSWPLPTQEIFFTDGLEKYKYFARFLLEGKIFSNMKVLDKYYNTKPAMITKTFSQNKILVLVQVLKENSIDSKKKLEEKWKQDPKFLLSALSLWTDRLNHKHLLAIWPPLDSKILPPEYQNSNADVENEE